MHLPSAMQDAPRVATGQHLQCTARADSSEAIRCELNIRLFLKRIAKRASYSMMPNHIFNRPQRT